MKKLTKQLSAILAAAVMTVSAAGTAAFALAPIPADFTGWVNGDKAWFYYTDDAAVFGKNYEIDGILYSFAEDGGCTGKYSGWTKQNGVKRRYSEGLPYTGWLKNKDGSKKYCLGGYLVTGNFQIGDKLYGFDKNGIYTGKSKPLNLTASCESRISSDTKKISITVQYHDGNDDKGYAVGEPTKMERWEKGKWVDCIGESVEYAVNDIAYELGGLGDCSVNFTKVPFYPQTYTGGNMPAGYYRITVPYGESPDYLNTEKNLYAIFEVVPPVEAKMSEEVYISEDSADIEFQAYVTVNSEKLSGKDISLKILKKTESGWETAVKEIKYDENSSCDSAGANGTISIDGYLPFEEGCYYYQTVVYAEGKQYGETYSGETYFRVEAREKN